MTGHATWHVWGWQDKSTWILINSEKNRRIILTPTWLRKCSSGTWGSANLLLSIVFSSFSSWPWETEHPQKAYLLNSSRKPPSLALSVHQAPYTYQHSILKSITNVTAGLLCALTCHYDKDKHITTLSWVKQHPVHSTQGTAPNVLQLNAT